MALSASAGFGFCFWVMWESVLRDGPGIISILATVLVVRLDSTGSNGSVSFVYSVWVGLLVGCAKALG